MLYSFFMFYFVREFRGYIKLIMLFVILALSTPEFVSFVTIFIIILLINLFFV